jgi:hypothetical protein
MNQHVKKAGLGMFLSLALLLGGMMFATGAQAQSGQHTVVVNAPNGKAWVSTSQANTVVSNEIAALTSQVSLLSATPNADQKLIKQLKTELRLFMLVQEGLNSGMTVSQAVEFAKSSVWSPTKAANKPVTNPNDKLQAIFDKVTTKLTI